MTLPEDILNDIAGTGWTAKSFHQHSVGIHILTLEKTADMNWDPKDFDGFGWVVGNYHGNNNEKIIKLKIRI